MGTVIMILVGGPVGIESATSHSESSLEIYGRLSNWGQACCSETRWIFVKKCGLGVFQDRFSREYNKESAAKFLALRFPSHYRLWYLSFVYDM